MFISIMFFNAYSHNLALIMFNSINSQIAITLDDDFVVFQTGISINHPWKLHNWIPAALSMPNMINELSYINVNGFLGYQLIGFFPLVIVQYWKSFEHLFEYRKHRNESHYPAWKDYIQKIKDNDDIGVWHETYKVKAGKMECIQNNIPFYGLGKNNNFATSCKIRETLEQ